MDTKEIARFFYVINRVGAAATHQGLLAMSRSGFFTELPGGRITIEAKNIGRIVDVLSGVDSNSTDHLLRSEAETFLQKYSSF